MNQTKKINLREIKIEGKSDRLIVWNSNRFNFEDWKNEKRGCRQFRDFLWQGANKTMKLTNKEIMNLC
ncbi:MAG: hypothetical protein I3273_06405 [Candidatus Moeniiplasma glomeromycotorum]|nr:hypothetical protein [Candidatus Moeniiplasma glomeromycotorum]MCE8168400.1 hypothetical protein [Candidatus Moeniiplasma glomeromycotorum]MCE8169716.1 hypothetical protein [Candidatus Moeniiplasma glomeromycotorum]